MNIKKLLIITLMLSCNSVLANNGLTFKINAFNPSVVGKGSFNAHAGNIIKYRNNFYWYGEDKGFGPGGGISLTGIHAYRSVGSNLNQWVDCGIVLRVKDEVNNPLVKGAILERPKVIYDKKNDNFKMWFHLELKGKGYSSALVGVASADSPCGDFKYLTSFRINKNKFPLNNEDLNNINGKFFYRDFKKGQMSRDMNVFIDDNGNGYLISSSEENQTLIISEMNKDYTALTGNFIRIDPGKANEAPVLFRKKNKYFIISSDTKGWSPSQARMYTSDSIFGKWIYIGNPTRGNADDRNTTYHSQGAFSFIEKGNYYFISDSWRPDYLGHSSILVTKINWQAGFPYLDRYKKLLNGKK